MNRESIILQHVRQDGLGLEIGPSHSPLAPKAAGYNVHVLDHLDQAGLRAKYAAHGVALEKIEEVDFVWDGRSYVELIGQRGVYDWIIASHVIEHTTDLVGFLNDCGALLKETGILSLVIPDKRFCFDHFRPTTGLARAIDLSLDKKSVHSAGVCAEYFLNVVSKAGQGAWCEGHPGDYNFFHSLTDARNAIQSVREQGKYLDVHEWCFTPTSFRLMIRDLGELGFIQLKELDFHPTYGCEFYATLSPSAPPPEIPRLEMLQRIRAEEAADH